MAICKSCGRKFSLPEVRKIINEKWRDEWGGDIYDTCTYGLCEQCADDASGSALGTWEELEELMPPD